MEGSRREEEEVPPWAPEVGLVRLLCSIHAGHSNLGLEISSNCSPLNWIDGDGEIDVSYDANDAFHDSSRDFDCGVDCCRDDVTRALNHETSPCHENSTFGS